MDGVIGVHSIYVDQVRDVGPKDRVGYIYDQQGNRFRASEAALVEYVSETPFLAPLFRFTGEVPRVGEELYVYYDTRVFVVRFVEWLMLHETGPSAAQIRVVDKAQMHVVVGSRKIVEKMKETP